MLSFILVHNTTLAAILLFALGIWVYFDRRHDPRHVTFGTLLLIVSGWMMTLVLWRGAGDISSQLFWLRTLFFIGSLIPLMFFIFVSSVTSGAPSLWVQGVAAVPNIYFFGVTYLSNSIVAQVGNERLLVSSGRGIFAIHFALLLAASLVIIYRASKKVEEKERMKLVFMLIGATIAFNAVFSVLYGTSFTTISDSIFIANVGLVIGMFVMASSVLERDFLTRVRMLGPQLFVILTLFVIIFNIVITETEIDFTLRLVMMSILVMYTALTTKTLIQEVHRIQNVEVMRDQAIKLNQGLIEADRLKSRFVSLASHQLRSPISGVRTYLDMLNQSNFGEVNEEQKRILSLNIGALDRLSETIETFLDAAKIQLGKLELFKVDVVIGQLILRATEELRAVAEKKGLTVTVDVQPELPPVFCDEGKIFHVIINLLDNAIKYTKSGNVTVSAAKEENGIVVRVKDNGMGLTDVDKTRIFEVFSRGMEAVRLDTGGSGLGLYIVKNILDAHKAAITVDSEGRGRGATFGFKLPIS